MLRLVAANSAWLTAERLVRALLGLLVGAWGARYLGPANYGTLAYVLSYVALFLPFATLSADAIVVRNIAQQPHDAPRTLGSMLALRVAFGLLVWLLAIGGMAAFSRDRELTALVAIVGGTLLFQAGDVVDLWLQSQTQSRRTVIAKLVATLATAGLRIALILAEAPLVAFAAAVLVEAALTAGTLALTYRRFRTDHPWGATLKDSKTLLAEAWPFVLSGCAVMLYMRIDQVMIKQMLGTHELGIYAAATTLSNFWQMVPTVLSISLAPFLARQRLEDFARYERSVVLIFRAFFFAGVLIALFTIVTAQWVVPALFGQAYASAAGVLALHVTSNVFCFLGIAHSLWLVNERRFAVRLWGTLAAGVAVVAINVTLLPVLGVFGACVAAIVSQAIAALLINVVLDRRGLKLQIEAITFIKA
ncbi:flippase [Rubrivivax sp. A210]|uniref:flippase n=1 Tax=Rubrivivax sp. A210 TaxID=2772301 RepID=UPI00191A5971|nr:flippase [Rubrivivax sp. A210]